MKVELELEGMSCNHCKMAVDQALAEVEGVSKDVVEIGRAVLSTDDWSSVESAVRDVLDEEGYPVKAVKEVA